MFAVAYADALEWPGDDSAPPEDAQSLITCLLRQSPLERLGTGGAQEVKAHYFFQNIDWNGLLRQKAEFVPRLDDDEDTSYFDSEYADCLTTFYHVHCCENLSALRGRLLCS